MKVTLKGQADWLSENLDTPACLDFFRYIITECPVLAESREGEAPALPSVRPDLAL